MTTPHALIDRVKNDISSLTSMNSIGIRLELITCILYDVDVDIRFMVFQVPGVTSMQTLP